jgi:hypothetical protein
MSHHQADDGYTKINIKAERPLFNDINYNNTIPKME